MLLCIATLNEVAVVLYDMFADCALGFQDVDDGDDPVGNALTDTDLDGDLTQLSFLRRQEVWLKRRQNSVQAKALEVQQ
jgi:hypothetical protein